MFTVISKISLHFDASKEAPRVSLHRNARSLCIIIATLLCFVKVFLNFKCLWGSWQTNTTTDKTVHNCTVEVNKTEKKFCKKNYSSEFTSFLNSLYSFSNSSRDLKFTLSEPESYEDELKDTWNPNVLNQKGTSLSIG